MALLPLPQLDGSRAAADARLDAWCRSDGSGGIEDALYTARCHVDEALTAAAALGKAEECDNEDCAQAGDLEWLKDELRKAGSALVEGAAALEALQVEHIDGAA